MGRPMSSTWFWSGDVLRPEQANYGEANQLRTRPVGSYPPNSFGLCDMLGNVEEFVHVAKGSLTWQYQRARGGAYANPAPRLRSASTASFGHDERRPWRGLRVLLPVSGAKSAPAAKEPE